MVGLQGEIKEAMHFVDEMDKKGYKASGIKGMCQVGKTRLAINMLWKHEDANCVLCT